MRAKSRPASAHSPAGQGRYPVRTGANSELRANPTRRASGRRGRDPAGRGARPQEHPGQRGRLLRAGRKVSAAGVRPYVGGDGEGGGRRAHRDLRAALRGQTRARHRRRAASRWRRRDLRAGRHPGGGRHGARHRQHRTGRHAGRPRQRLRGRGQAPALRPRRHRPAGGAHRDSGNRRRDRGRRALRHRSARPGRARPDFAGDPADQLREPRPADDGRGRAPARHPADGRDCGPGLARLRPGDRLRHPRRDGRGRGRDRGRACAGDDRGPGLVSSRA